MTSNSNDIIRLNVGGQHFITTRTTLCAVEGSLLEKMFRSDSNFAQPIEIGGEVFLDRNPIAFGCILDYLRDAGHVMVDLQSNADINDQEDFFRRLRTDADYFGLQGLVVYCDTKLFVLQDDKMKEMYYDYLQNSDCVSPGPGWRLYKYIPSIYNSTGDRRVEGENFIFEISTHTSKHWLSSTSSSSKETIKKQT